ncbi:hypothetical protein DH2020_045534 [Rehmannia glutinosa]|uniref:YqgF/RNase H-like domain-containing protein n=1 Tax=Rehmannia glutinosa TaxID=99300 RepID=A0ABR0UDV3_REHGL
MGRANSPNALRRKRDSSWRGGFSLGVDLGLSRTGLALSKGFSIRPLTEVDEFIIGLPKSSDGNETEQSNKVRSVAGRFAVRAAERGWRVYLQDEHGTSAEALDHMIAKGISKSARHERIDAYAAMKVLERYFSYSGKGIELVVPKQVGHYDAHAALTPDKLRADPEAIMVLLKAFVPATRPNCFTPFRGHARNPRAGLDFATSI